MPPPRRSSPRRKERRSRSYSPRTYKKKRSPSRERRRSRSPVAVKRERSRSRHKSPRKRSRTPERSSPGRRKSLGSKRRSSSPQGYDIPVKRQADSTRRTYRSKSRSRSPRPTKKSGEYARHRSRSPSYSGKMYSDKQPSSSKKSSEKGSSRTKKDSIDVVKIVDQGKKMPKLDIRFQTLEQLAQGGFDFEENITIGIHRGPQHIDLDEDVPVNYDFNSKLFIMLHPKKDYSNPLFERDEILAFHHDDVLDEEAYVEKRTITVKPTDKPKPSTSSSNSRYRDGDYKITIGTDRDSHGDRRMVYDSRSRSSRYDTEVKIRLDPKPDPKYERLYKEQRRHEDKSQMDDNIPRNPSDLRYNLMRKKSSDDRDRDLDRGRGREPDLSDARARIEAKRRSYSEKSSRDLSPPSPRFEKRRIGIKTELPDFKNRPDKFKYDEWKDNPEMIPKGASYYEHDSRSRDDMTFWERKQIFIRTGRYPTRGANRGSLRGSLRGRGIIRGPSRGPRGVGRDIQRSFVQRPTQKLRTPFMDEWKHDKFEDDDTSTDNDRKGRKQEERGYKKGDKSSSTSSSSIKRKERDISAEEAALNTDSNITVTVE